MHVKLFLSSLWSINSFKLYFGYNLKNIESPGRKAQYKGVKCAFPTGVHTPAAVSNERKNNLQESVQ